MTSVVAILVLALLTAVLAAPPAASQGPGEPLLGGVTVQEVMRHAALASQIVDYEGTKILSVLRGSLMETVTLAEAHKRPAKTRLEFLSPEGVAGRLIVDDGAQTWHYEPRLNIAFIGPSMAVPADAAASLPTDRYHVRLMGLEDVIGRPTVVLSLWPQAGRRERRLWIDRTTGVALRSEERDPDQGLIATAYFTRISFGMNLPNALFRLRLPAGARIIGQVAPVGPLLPLPEVERAVRFPVRAPGALPGGFALRGGLPVRDGPVLAAHLQYSDGVRSLALFVAPASRLGPPGRGEPVAALGAEARTLIVGAMRLLLWEAHGSRHTLVGPLSLAELLTAAEALGKVRP